jgi:hypothetical protein
MGKAGLLTGTNVGGYDLLVRALIGCVGIVLLAVGLIPENIRWIAAIVTAIALYTSITRHCGPYALLGINTSQNCSTKKACECDIE